MILFTVVVGVLFAGAHLADREAAKAASGRNKK
jgi:hypothetical protein